MEYGIELHGKLHDYYRSVERESNQERVKMILDYLSRHESDRRAALERFAALPHETASDVWLQFAPSTRVDEMLQSHDLRPDSSTDDVIRTAMAFDEALIEIYKEAAREAEDTNAQEIFQSLVEAEEQERQRFIRDCGWFSDM